MQPKLKKQHNMKKALFLLLTSISLFAIVGCEKEEEPQKQQVKVVESITVNDSIIMTEGESRKLSYHIYPKELSIYTKVVWSSLNENVATVSSTGEVKAIKKGTCQIVVATADQKHKASCLVTVNEKPKEPILPPTLSFNVLYLGGDIVELGDDNTIYNVKTGQTISGSVSIKSKEYIRQIYYMYNNNVSGFTVSPNGWWTDYVTSSLDKPQNYYGYYYLKDGCKSATLSFVFTAKSNISGSKITFSATDVHGNSSDLVLTIVE